MAEIIPIISKSYDSNVYLILDEKRVIIDTGLGSTAMLKEVEKHIAIEEIDYVINTHAHADHVLGNPAFKGADVLIHEKDAQALVEGSLYSTSRMFNISGKFKYNKLLKEGDKISLGKIELNVLHTPGHTPGSICLYHKDMKAIFSGDLVFAGGSFGRVDFGGNSEELKTSLKRVSEMDIDILYAGHDRIVEKNAGRDIKQACQSSTTKVVGLSRERQG